MKRLVLQLLLLFSVFIAACASSRCPESSCLVTKVRLASHPGCYRNQYVVVVNQSRQPQSFFVSRVRIVGAASDKEAPASTFADNEIRPNGPFTLGAGGELMLGCFYGNWDNQPPIRFTFHVVSVTPTS